MSEASPQRPRVVAIAASSLDGKITRHDEAGTAFTSAADKAYFHRALTQFDCSIMGRVTFEASRDFILSRLSRDRLRVIVTRTPELFAQWAQPGLLEFSDTAPSEILSDLHGRGYKACAHLGGSDAYTAFQAQGLIDAWWLTFEPRLFGTGRPIINQTLDARMTLDSAERLDSSDTLLVKYSVNRVSDSAATPIHAHHSTLEVDQSPESA